jgi:uracil-DNA glycosylase
MKISTVPNMIPEYSTWCKSVEQRWAGKKGRILLADGGSNAKVAVVGFRPDVDEAKVFTGDISGVGRKTIVNLGVPSHAIWYTYVVKQDTGNNVLLWKDIAPWVDDLFKELAIVECRATILLGVEVAWAILGSEESDIEKLRKVRFTHDRAPQTNFFVTYSQEQVIKCGIPSDVAASFDFDLLGVFEVQEEYYKKHLAMKG